MAVPLRPSIRSPPTRSLAGSPNQLGKGGLMPKKLRFGGVVALLLAVVSLPAAGASPSAARSSADDDVEVIRVTAIDVQDTFLDLGEPGDSLGDQSVFSQDLFRQGAKVGTAGVVCT